MRRFGTAERRARLGDRHRLTGTSRVADPAAAADAVVALHGTDAASVYLSAWARMTDGDVASVDRALYEDRSLVRVAGMRRTVFVAPVATAPVVVAACGRTVAGRERRKLLAMVAASDVTADPDTWLRDTEALAVRVLSGGGELTASELAAADPRLATEVVLSPGKPYEGRQKVASRLLFQLSAEGRVVRARPRGTWTSTQFRWTTWERWCPHAPAEPDIERAEADLAGRWLRAFGPATAADLQWWTGWNGRQTTRALAAIGAVAVDLDGVPGVALPDDLEPVQGEPWVALLPALDPTPMGWTHRGWFLGEHGPRLFDSTGNAGPTAWCDGRVVGGWAQRPDGEVRFGLLEDVGAEAVAAFERAAADLRVRLGDARPGARARGISALERDLLV